MIAEGPTLALSDDSFWVPVEEFSRLFDSLAVFMVELDFFFEGVQVQQLEGDGNQSIVAFNLDKDMDLTVCLDQNDKRTHLDREDYSLSYFRLTIGKLADEDVLFVDSKLSAQRSLFLSDELPKGDYVAFVEAYWTDGSPAKSFTIGVYSSSPVKVTSLEAGKSLFSKAEYLLWTNFARNNRASFEPKQNKSSAGSSLDVRELSGFDFGVTLQAFFNDLPDQSVLLEFDTLPGQGLDSVFERQVIERKKELALNPGDCKVVLHKIDPRAKEHKSGHIL